MKILFASDIHGSASACEKVLERVQTEKADRLILMGDLLYHGPRNDLPDRYAPKEVIRLLNESPLTPLCVRGNCDAEIDQMVLNFPIMSEMLTVYADGLTMYAVHGHKELPKALAGNIILSGHTHIFKAEKTNGVICLNPGSVSIPKNGNPRSYMVYSKKEFTLKELSGTVLWDFPAE